MILRNDVFYFITIYLKYDTTSCDYSFNVSNCDKFVKKRDLSFHCLQTFLYPITCFIIGLSLTHKMQNFDWS